MQEASLIDLDEFSNQQTDPVSPFDPWEDEPTQEIPRITMWETVYGVVHQHIGPHDVTRNIRAPRLDDTVNDDLSDGVPNALLAKGSNQ